MYGFESSLSSRRSFTRAVTRNITQNDLRQPALLIVENTERRMKVSRLISMCLAAMLASAYTSIIPTAVAYAPSASGASFHQTAFNSNRGSALPASLAAGSGDYPPDVADFSDVGFVLLAGGTGSRMKANMPKQFLTLQGMPVLHHSLALFLEYLPAYAEANGCRGPPVVVLVMDPKYQPEYQPIVDSYRGQLAFANPGEERQGSVENGLSRLVELAGDACRYVAVHDSARPLVTVDEIQDVVNDAKEHGAAVLGVPCKATIKESEDGEMILRTIPRARLWEVHTPQVIDIKVLQEGFAKVEAENLEVTDDVSIVEALGKPVKLTKGEYTNLKITTPEDMEVATAILEERGTQPIDLLGMGNGLAMREDELLHGVSEYGEYHDQRAEKSYVRHANGWYETQGTVGLPPRIGQNMKKWHE